jgi:hypothetical protein
VKGKSTDANGQMLERMIFRNKKYIKDGLDLRSDHRSLVGSREVDVCRSLQPWNEAYLDP